MIAATASVIGSVATHGALGLVLDATAARTTVAVMVVAPLVGLGGLGVYVKLARRTRRIAFA